MSTREEERGALEGTVQATVTLLPSEVDRMQWLMEQYFSGLNRDCFLRDLAEKPWVITLRDRVTGLLHGFSTICLMDERVHGIPVRAVFSGDTIIDRPYWGALALERAWLDFLAARVAEAPDARWYWFLICKGYRTYRYLPVYFHRYHPSPHPMPGFDRAVLDRLASRRFGSAYDAASGVIRGTGDYRLRGGVGDITARERRDPRVAFFEERNAGWQRGDELACLAELSRENFRPAALRLLGKAAVG